MSDGNARGDVFCIECGERIRARTEICPECGVRQPIDGPTDPGGSRGGSRSGGGTGRESYGILFAHVDANKRKKLLRVLFDLVLVFSSVGLYLGVIVGEGLRHYYKLNRGTREPFDPQIHDKVYIV